MFILIFVLIMIEIMFSVGLLIYFKKEDSGKIRYIDKFYGKITNILKTDFGYQNEVMMVVKNDKLITVEVVVLTTEEEYKVDDRVHINKINNEYKLEHVLKNKYFVPLPDYKILENYELKSNND